MDSSSTSPSEPHTSTQGEPTLVSGTSHSTSLSSDTHSSTHISNFTTLSSYTHSSTPVPPSFETPRPEDSSTIPNSGFRDAKFHTPNSTKGKEKVGSLEVSMTEGVDDDDDN
ncbi:hypothetical protein HAX54_053015, partial [Datura stramonium]|nr:hypothetical protein [Datura stramonium]